MPELKLPIDEKFTINFKANGGKFFLDEIGELSTESQAKLLQFLQSGQYYPLGSSKMLTADIRMIFATNRDLREQVANGNFREDLYFRINTFELTMPNLAQRQSDIRLLASGFLAQCVARHGFPDMHLNKAVIAHLETMNFPGNMRGLSSTIERACINARIQSANEVLMDHLPPTAESPLNTTNSDFQAATLSFQEKLLREKLSQTGWNISKTARELNLSRSHVHNLINTFDLQRH